MGIGRKQVVAGWPVCALAGAAIALIPACTAPDVSPGSALPPRQSDLVVQAETALAAGDSDQALALLALAIERNPTLTVAHLKMGEIHESRGDLLSAEATYRTAADIEPSSFDAQYRHGFVLHSLNRLSEAIRAYLRALALRPDDFEANLNLAIAYLDLNEPSLAERFARDAARLKPDSGEAHANFANTLAELGRDSEAVIEYETASELMELDAGLLMNMAQSLGRLERYAEMENTLRRAVEVNESAGAWERLGYAQFKRGEMADAVASFTRAIEIDPGHYPALNGLGVCLLNRWHESSFADQEARREGIRLLRESLRVRPNQSRIVQLLEKYDS